MKYNPEYVSNLINETLIKEGTLENSPYDIRSLFEYLDQPIEELLLCEGLERAK